MRTLRALMSLAMLLSLIGLVSGTTASPAFACPSYGAKFEPADGKTLMIVGQGRDQQHAYVQATGHVPGGFMPYVSLAAPEYGTSLPGTTSGATWHHAQNGVDTYPDSVVQLGLYVRDQLGAINLGLYDSQIQTLGNWIAQSSRPVFLRIGYEANADHNHHDPPAAFVTAWKRIVDRLRAQGVTNVAFVWHLLPDVSFGGRPFTDWYPGDAYVDWVGVSLFAHLFAVPPATAIAHDIADFADAHGKPLMVAESTPAGKTTANEDASTLWNQWYAPVIDYIETRGVKAWSYIDVNWSADIGSPAGWGDSRVEMNPALKSLWLAEISRTKYLSASPTLFCDGLGY